MEDLIENKLKLLRDKRVRNITRVIWLIKRYKRLNKNIDISEVVINEQHKYRNFQKRKLVNDCWELLRCEEEVLLIVKDPKWVQEVFTFINNGNKRRSFELSNIIKKVKYDKPS